MRSFVVKFVIVLGLVFVLDLIVGKVMDRLFTDLPSRESETSIIYRALFTERAETLILGSSTANHHYNTQMISDCLNTNAYNAGVDGHDLVFSDLVFKSFLERNQLKRVIIDIGFPNIDGYWKNHYGTYKQYYGRNQYVTDYFNEDTDIRQRVKLKSNLYRYNGTLHSLFSILCVNRPVDNNRGYRPLAGCKPFEYKTVNGFKPDSEELKHLMNIVKECSNNDIQLVLVKSPFYIDNLDFNNWLESFGEEYGILVIMENCNPFWREHAELFFDGSHLNAEGSVVLTQRVCEKIKEFENSREEI